MSNEQVVARDLARRFAARFPRLGSRVSAELECELAVELAWLIGEREGLRARAEAAEKQVQEDAAEARRIALDFNGGAKDEEDARSIATATPMQAMLAQEMRLRNFVAERLADVLSRASEVEALRQQLAAAEARIQEMAERLGVGLAEARAEAKALRMWRDVARERVENLEDDVAGLQKRLDAATDGNPYTETEKQQILRSRDDWKNRALIAEKRLDAANSGS